MKLVAARRGALTCFIRDIPPDGTFLSGNATLGPMPAISGAEMFVVSSEKCIAEVYKDHGTQRQNLPYLMFMMVLVIQAIDILSYRIRLFEQKIQRFHQIVIKKGVLGSGDHHQDVDDILKPMDSPIFKEAIKAVAKDRSRIELCEELKRSSTLFYVFTTKNIVQVVVIGLFLAYEHFVWSMKLTTTPKGRCNSTHSQAILKNQEAVCQEKFAYMFGLFMGSFMILCFVYAVCSMGCLLFLLTSRPVSNFICKLNRLLKKHSGDGEAHLLGHKRETVVQLLEGAPEASVTISAGRDFIFLFDLLAHNYGLEHALKLMTQVDKDTCAILAPEVYVKDDDVGTNHLSIEWSPAKLDDLFKEHGHSLSHWSFRECKFKQSLNVDSYQVTVIQMDEKLQNIVEYFKVHSSDVKRYDRSSRKYQVKLENLAGGQNRYAITVSSIISECQMQGSTLLRFLCPNDPESPQGGMVQKVDTHSVEIKWIPPFGSFDRYLLTAELKEGGMITRSVDKKEKSFTLVGLAPGNNYELKLRTVTGIKQVEEVRCKKPVKSSILTKPLAPQNLDVKDLSLTTCTIIWYSPDKKEVDPNNPSNELSAHTCLQEFKVQIMTPSEVEEMKNTEKEDKEKDKKNGDKENKEKDAKNKDKENTEKNNKENNSKNVIESVFVPVHTCGSKCGKRCNKIYSHTFKGLAPGSKYDVKVFSICSSPTNSSEKMEGEAAITKVTTEI